MRKCEACRRGIQAAHESAQTARGTWVCADTYACRDALRARVSELEDTIILDKCDDAIARSVGRNTYAVEVAAAIRARRGDEWNGAEVKGMERI